MFQSALLRVITKVGLFVLQITGLWPFSYDHQSNEFKFLWYFTVIPVFVTAYPIVQMFFLSKFVKVEIFGENTVVKIVSIAFVFINLIDFIIMYIGQYLKFQQIKELIFKSQNVIKQLNNELDRSEFRYGKPLLKFTVKTVICMLLLIYCVYQSVKRYTKFEDNWLFFALTALPNIIMKLHPDIFYGGQILINFYITQINSKISNVLAKAQNLSETNDLSEQKRYQKMIDFCELSDQLDRLCVLHSTFIEVSQRFCRICSFQVTLWVVIGLCVFLVNMFQVGRPN